MNGGHNSQDTDDASADFLIGNGDVETLLERDGMSRDEARSMITGAHPTRTVPSDNPPDRPPVENQDLLDSIDPNRLGQEHATSTQPQPTPGVNVIHRDADTQEHQEAKEFRYDFGTSQYRNDVELSKGVMHKDRVIQEFKDKETQWEQSRRELIEQLESERAQMNVVTGLYTSSLPDEESQVDAFARALLSEEFRDKSDRDFDINPEDYMVSETDFSVDESDYDDDNDYNEALNQARARRIKKQRSLDKKLREDQIRVAADLQRYIREREHARSQVVQQIDEQKRLSVQAREDGNRRLIEATASLKEELTEEALGLHNPEDYIVLQGLLYKKPVPVRVGAEVVERSLAELLVQMRADYGRSVTDLIIKGLRHEIRGDSPISIPTRAFSATSLRGTRGPAVHAAPVVAEVAESKRMFEDADFA